MKFTKGRVDVITMGCSKNLVDSERLMKRFEALNLDMHHDSHDVCGEFVVVNTCGFIGDAKQESIDMILSLAEAKKEGRIGKLYVMGCLSERYRTELTTEIPEVDRYFGKFDWESIVDEVKSASAIDISDIKLWDRTLTTPKYSAYLKISEGCNRFCAYCAIPLITGRHHSRSKEEILEEVRTLVARGVKEFNVIAQDLSAYGTDIYGRSALASLIDEMARIDGVDWIRLHYAYPVDFPFDVLDMMNKHANVCKYLDIALQHISTPVLDKMRRHINKEDTLNLLERIRAAVPDIKIRTTLMTGFPGEGEEQFEELKSFVKEFKFDRLGVFAYSEEDDTWAQKNYSDDIPESVKEQRRDEILAMQEEISAQLNAKMIGKTVSVLIDRDETDYFVGRTQWDSPEVDNEVYISKTDKTSSLIPGDMVDVLITDAEAYDLYGEVRI